MGRDIPFWVVSPSIAQYSSFHSLSAFLRMFSSLFSPSNPLLYPLSIRPILSYLSSIKTPLYLVFTQTIQSPLQFLSQSSPKFSISLYYVKGSRVTLVRIVLAHLYLYEAHERTTLRTIVIVFVTAVRNRSYGSCDSEVSLVFFVSCLQPV